MLIIRPELRLDRPQVSRLSLHTPQLNNQPPATKEKVKSETQEGLDGLATQAHCQALGSRTDCWSDHRRTGYGGSRRRRR
ncbi:MAG TPA: hypothetical protein VNX65_04450 [Patescibacteria group bacterium]|nr:hypothetical protein [Patescibacteria group bacterium]